MLDICPLKGLLETKKLQKLENLALCMPKRGAYFTFLKRGA